MSSSGRSGGKDKKKHEKGADAGKPGRGTGSQLTGNLTSGADGSRSQQRYLVLWAGRIKNWCPL